MTDSEIEYLCDRNSYWVFYEDYEYSDLRYIKSKVEE